MTRYFDLEAIHKWTHYAGLTSAEGGSRGISKEPTGAKAGAKAKAALKKHATMISALLSSIEADRSFDLGAELGADLGSSGGSSSMPYAPLYGDGADGASFQPPLGAPSLKLLDSAGSEQYEEKDFLPAEDFEDANEDDDGRMGAPPLRMLDSSGSAADLMQFVDLSQLEAMIAEEASGSPEAAGPGGGVAVSELIDMLDGDDQLHFGMQPLPLQALPSHSLSSHGVPLDLPS